MLFIIDNEQMTILPFIEAIAIIMCILSLVHGASDTTSWPETFPRFFKNCEADISENLPKHA